MKRGRRYTPFQLLHQLLGHRKEMGSGKEEKCTFLPVSLDSEPNGWFLRQPEAPEIMGKEMESL